MTMAACRRLLWPLAYGLFLSSCLIMLFFSATDISQMMKARRMQQRQEWRKQLINKLCPSHNKRFLEELSPESLSNFLVDDAHGFIYCYNPKVATTTMKKILVTLKNGPPYGDPRLLTGRVHYELDDNYLKNYPQHEIKAKLKHYTKFTFVREPLVRLISAYQSKILRGDGLCYDRHAKRLLRLYDHPPYPPKKKGKKSAPVIPFSSFMEYLVDPRTASESGDEHWNRINDTCHPCHLQYDFIGHQETMDEDTEYLLEMLNLKEIKIPSSNINVNTKDSLAQWYKTVPLDVRRKLYNKYEIDYKLFGYNRPDGLLKD